MNATRMSEPTTTGSDKDNAAPTATMADNKEGGDLAKSDYVPWKNRKRPPGSQVGRYKRFDKSIPNGAERVLEPGKYDVVFGRGKGSHDHPGNKRMREIIRRHKKDYAAIHRSKKRQIAEFVYSEITQDGARFLHKIKNEDAYAVVDLNLALQKLSNTLRCRKSCLIGDDEDEDQQDAAEQEDSASAAHSPSNTATPSPVISGSSTSSIGAAASAAGLQALRHSLASRHSVGQLPPHAVGSLFPPPIGLTPVSALHRLEASDPLLRQRYLGGLTAASRAELLLPTTSLAERELLLRRTTALSPLGGGGGGSSLLGSSLLARDPLLSSASSWGLPSKEYSEQLARAEEEYLMVRTRLRAAALGM